MSSRKIHRRRTIAAAVATLSLAAPSAALAVPPGDTKHDLAGATVAVKAGDTKHDVGASMPADLVVVRGDTPVDHPGASRSPAYEPPSIEVVRPIQTVVRDVDEALPIVLSGVALLLAVAGLGIVLSRTRTLRIH